MDNHLDRPEIQQLATDESGSAIRFSDTLDIDMFYVGVKIEDQGETLGYLRLAIPLATIEADLSQLRQILLGITLIASILAVLVAILVASQTTKPLRQLADTAAEISAGNLQARFIPTTQDEVGQVATAIDQMSQQLQSQISALQAERLKLEVLLRQLHDAVIMTDASGTVELANHSAGRLFALEGQEVIGQPIARILRHHQLIEIWQRARDTRQDQVDVLELLQAQVFLQASARTIQLEEQYYVLMLFQDLTEVRKFETVRRDFISNISHELRTPLASLKALTETLQDGAIDDREVAVRFLNRIEAEVDSLVVMVGELLELTKIESGRVPIELAPVKPKDLLTQAFQRMHAQAEREGIIMQIVPGDELPQIYADAPRLLQVLINLIHNAIKFTPSGGQIELSAYQQAENVTFCVSDTGTGIPREDRARIFERFFKGDRSRSGGGTGLGLSIAKHTIEGHRGKIWVESEEGRGSRFYFSIPAVK
jgi:two-component system phosphate regulon sensor histidine kinase PhoR